MGEFKFMKKRTIQTILHVFVVAVMFFFGEFALPASLHAQMLGSKDVLVARRNKTLAVLKTSRVPDRALPPVVVVPQIAVVQTMTMVVTAYSSTPDQCSGDPFITANGSRVHEGTFAVNGFKFGTKIRIPQYFGDKIFVVEDRMSSRYGKTRGDIWMPTRQQAIQWGARHVMVEIVQEG